MTKDSNMLLPELFRFSLGFSETQSQTIEWKESELNYDIFHHGRFSEKRSTLPTALNWSEFWKTLDALDVWHWNERIEGPNIQYREGAFWNTNTLDGQSWSLQIKLADREISCVAHNCYPDVKSPNYGKTFRSFLEAIDRLLDLELFFNDPASPKPTQKDHARAIVLNSFTPVFRYKVENGHPIKEKILNEELWQSDGVVYARIHRKEIAYIGKTNSTLKGRIKDHLRRMPNYSRSKDIEYRDWAEGKTITLYAHKPNNKDYLGLSVPIHTGLEHALIDAIKPPFVSRK